MHSYLEKQNKAPEIGQYDPNYKQVDPEVIVRDF